MRLLFITEITPFPVLGGERLRSYGYLKMLSNLKAEVIAIIGDTGKAYLEYEKEFKNIRFIEYDFKKEKFYGKRDQFFRRFASLEEKINTILDEQSIDVAFLDYHFLGHYIPLFKRRNIPVIYGTHNAQAKLYYELPAPTLRDKLRSLYIYFLQRMHEIVYFSRADAIITVSDDDAKYHRTFFMPKKKVYMIPNYLVGKDYRVTGIKKEDYIIMTGNFEAPQNSLGLEWLLSEVWDDELAGMCELRIAGILSHETLDHLKQKLPAKRVKSLGKVPDLKPLIAKARLSIVPLLHGSGTRLKCIEAMALKTQLISTSKGAEGIEHHGSIVIADTPEDFKKAIINVLSGDTDFTRQAYDVFKRVYELKPNQRIFESLLENLHIH